MTTDLEELLRSTLADPRRRLTAAPGQLDDLERAIVRRRRGRLAGAAGGAALLLVLGAGLTELMRPLPQGSGRPAATATGPAPTSPGVAGLGESFVLPGPAIDLGLQGASLWALTGGVDTRAVRLDLPTGRTTASVRLAGGNPGGLRVDPATGDAWAWTERTDAEVTTLARVVPGRRDPAATAVLTGSVLDAVAADGVLWVGTSAAVYRWQPGAAPAQVRDLSRSSSSPVALAFDRARHRLLVGLSDGRLLALDAGTGATSGIGTYPYGKGALAFTGNGRLWEGGYIGDGPTVQRLDPQTLAVLGSSPVAAGAGPGAWVWPGEQVVWVRNGGDTGLTCVAADTGEPLQRWDAVQGPVVSSPQQGAFAVDQGALYRLPLRGCAG